MYSEFRECVVVECVPTGYPFSLRHKREWQSVREGKSPICYQERAGKLSHHLQSQIYTDLPQPIRAAQMLPPTNQSPDNLSSIDTPYAHP